jgi:hypothetical protein
MRKPKACIALKNFGVSQYEAPQKTKNRTTI